MAKFFLFLWDHKQSLIFLLLLLLSLAALSLSGTQRFHLARQINRTIITPFQMAVSQVDYVLRLKKENEGLRKNNFMRGNKSPRSPRLGIHRRAAAMRTWGLGSSAKL